MSCISLYFKCTLSIFSMSVYVDAKKKKIENSGVVAFDVYLAKDKDGLTCYKIDPRSLLTIYRGFTAK